MRAGDGDAVLQAHQLGQHLGARDDRDLPAPRLGHLRVVGLDGAREDHDVRALDVLRRVAQVDLSPPSSSSRRVAAPAREIRAGDPVAQVQQDLGDAAHPDAADPDEMHLPDFLHAISSSTSSATPDGRVGAGQLRRGALHRRQPVGILQQRLDLARQPGSGEVRLGQDARRSRLPQLLGVLPLVVGGGVRVGDQDGCFLAGGDLADGRRAGARHDQVGLLVLLRHVLQVRHDPGVEPLGAVGCLHPFAVLVPGHVGEAQRQPVRRQGRQRVDHRLVHGPRSLAPPEHQHAERSAALLRLHGGELLADRVAGHLAASPSRSRVSSKATAIRSTQRDRIRLARPGA